MRNGWLLRCIFPVSIFGLGACSGGDVDPLRVTQFHLREVNPVSRDAQMVRGEHQYRLKGAVSLEERRERLGQYYTVNWNNSAGQPDRVVMEYQQAATGSLVKRKVRELPLTKMQEGKFEFKITGDDYHQGGRVLAWRVRLFAGQRVLSEQRSYLWR